MGSGAIGATTLCVVGNRSREEGTPTGMDNGSIRIFPR